MSTLRIKFELWQKGEKKQLIQRSAMTLTSNMETWFKITAHSLPKSTHEPMLKGEKITLENDFKKRYLFSHDLIHWLHRCSRIGPIPIPPHSTSTPPQV